MITTQELRQVFNRLIVYLKQTGKKEICFDDEDDFYLKIWTDKRENFLKIFHTDGDRDRRLPHTVGELSDNMEYLKRWLIDKEEEPTTG